MNKTLPLLCLLLLAVSPGAGATGQIASEALEYQGERITSALAVTTKQTGVSSNVIGSAQLEIQKALTNARTAIETNSNMLNAVISFSPVLGQPSTGHCGAFENARRMTATGEQALKDAAKMMVSYSSARVTTRVTGVDEKIQLRKSAYCAITEAQQGYCTLEGNGMQSADADYSASIASAVTLAPEAEQAAYAYASHLTDVRAEAVADCRSASCEASQLRQMAASAASSMAAAALIGQITERRITAIPE